MSELHSIALDRRQFVAMLAGAAGAAAFNLPAVAGPFEAS